jgi:hypothetical protein
MGVMRPGTRRLLSLVVLVCAAWPLNALGAAHVRNGFCAGVGFGLESVAWTDANGSRRPAEGSGVLNARAGYAVKPDLVLGVEFWGWAKSYELSTSTLPVPVNVKLSGTTACVTYFPGAAGFFVRAGAGLAYGQVSVEPPPSVNGVASSKDTRTGLALDLAPGYEWRVASRFALGFQGDFVYLGLDSELSNVFGYGLNAQFNWYW